MRLALLVLLTAAALAQRIDPAAEQAARDWLASPVTARQQLEPGTAVADPEGVTDRTQVDTTTGAHWVRFFYLSRRADQAVREELLVVERDERWFVQEYLTRREP